jgi:His/Glu/Gln/Arg/opine family amino acid ABC transporter permease subunit
MDYTFNWTIVLSYAPAFVQGLLLGLGLAVLSLGIGSVIGFVCASAATLESPPIRWLIRAYVEIFRNVPILLWTYFAFYGIGRLGFGVLDNVWSFVLALSLYGGAYLTEVFRAGLGAIPRRYGEAAMAVGLRRFQRIRLVTLPLMFRIVLPSLSNTFISLFKDTSIASAIAVPELTFVALKVNQDTFRIIEVWVIAGSIYLAVCWLIALGLRRLERRFRVAR